MRAASSASKPPRYLRRTGIVVAGVDEMRMDVDIADEDCVGASVCVNVLAPGFGLWSIFRDRCAKASVRLFARAKLNGCTLKHGFFADMGGLHLQVPNVKSFPVNSKQLHFLVSHGHVQYPEITTTTINDKNKTDGLARLICTVQIFWFTLSTVSRPIKGYATTTLELTTLAYIVCALATLFFWRHKPMDVQTALVLHCPTPLDQIVNRDGRSAAEHYHFTPLDFISREERIGSRLWVYYVNLLRKMKLVHAYKKLLPVRHVSSFNFSPPDRLMLFLMLGLSFGYASVFVAAWNLHFPTHIEQLLWRTCSLGTMLIVLLGGVFEVAGMLPEYRRRRPFIPDSDSEVQLHEIPAPPAPTRSHPLAKEPSTRLEVVLQDIRNKTPDKDPHYDIPIRSLVVTTPLCALYCVFRAVITIEDVATLRELPASAFMAIEWSMYVPHI
ncbi:hypothetical protein BDV95DRAFT_679431 [Massariosphaeria phaeospora]|uniref:Uncharacterized protein n=1 Tax=Massariosphaeria phaeospora TaxID=100035 RepID=A0A7C8I0L2_9PLEO|nr:hypothetical protein BDV95DRAFT_679431 [Massariosphaeria phaeospora]